MIAGETTSDYPVPYDLQARMTVPLSYYLVLSGFVFLTGVVGS